MQEKLRGSSISRTVRVSAEFFPRTVVVNRCGDRTMIGKLSVAEIGPLHIDKVLTHFNST